MKKLFLFIAFLSLAQLVNSQTLSRDFSAQLDSSGMYLQMASSNLKFSLGTIAISGACAYWASNALQNNPSEQPTLQYILAGGFAVTGLAFYVANIINMGKSGDHLVKANRILERERQTKLSFVTNTDGVGIALKF